MTFNLYRHKWSYYEYRLLALPDPTCDAYMLLPLVGSTDSVKFVTCFELLYCWENVWTRWTQQ